ncbi:MAG: hypothetical protein HOI80_05050 [Alphaproteobacteria bacterium]|nr:hypothetical protein [Alphaproteobacteria bacterium]MBT5390231.1 hypothetical protein [Alphaproteobacteria bacterium]MBT5654845.1 hypothetical protein [Alphaproteobacteria bacterium]
MKKIVSNSWLLYNFPAEHWKHIRTTNPIESTFAKVKRRTRSSKGCLARETAFVMVFKLIKAAEKTGVSLLKKISCQKLSQVSTSAMDVNSSPLMKLMLLI